MTLFRRPDPDRLIQDYRAALEATEAARRRLDERARRAEGFVPKTEVRLDLLEQRRPGLSPGLWLAVAGVVALYTALIALAIWLTTS